MPVPILPSFHHKQPPGISKDKSFTSSTLLMRSQQVVACTLSVSKDRLVHRQEAGESCSWRPPWVLLSRYRLFVSDGEDRPVTTQSYCDAVATERERPVGDATSVLEEGCDCGCESKMSHTIGRFRKEEKYWMYDLAPRCLVMPVDQQGGIQVRWRVVPFPPRRSASASLRLHAMVTASLSRSSPTYLS